MHNYLNIINAKLPRTKNLQRIGVNKEGTIEVIAPMSDNWSGGELLDVAGDWISLGGLDLQINGGLGLAFPDLDKQHIPQLQQICEFLWHQGVDEFLPTIVTTSVENIQRSLRILSDFMALSPSPNKAKIIGVHLEGPFLNPKKRGAHPAEHLLPLTLENVKRVLGEYAEIVKIITLAPELDPTGQVISYLHDLGIIVSLGHSLATATEAAIAFQLGASMVTHAFNAMPSLHHREPGLLGEAIINPNVYCGLIADGNHVCPTMMKLLLSASGCDRGIFLVSDALAPIGLPDGIYPWDSREIEVKNGTARLLNGTLAGTTLSLLVGVENLFTWGICGVEEAIAMATQSPRKALSLTGIAIGKTAQFLRWNLDEETSKLTWRRLEISNRE